MSIDAQKNMFHALHEWFLTPAGIRVAEAFNTELKALTDILHGETMVQLGSCGDNIWFPQLRYMHKWLLSPVLDSDKTVLLSSINQLPLQRDSVDCVFAPLTLNAFSHNVELLDEVDRVLKPMGYAVFLAVNPVSLWGMWLKLSRSNCFATKNNGLHSSLFTQHALSHRGYEICHLSNFYYIPPVSSQKMLSGLSILNVIGKMLSPLPSGFYYLIVRKLQEDFLLPQAVNHSEPLKTQAISGLSPACQQKIN